MKLTFLFLLIANISFCQSPYGDWYATLKTANLPLVFHIKKDGKDNQISVDSPKQNAFDMPGEIFISKDNSLKVEMPKLGVTYEGTYYSDSISGLFKQGPIVETLTFYPEKIETKKQIVLKIPKLLSPMFRRILSLKIFKTLLSSRNTNTTEKLKKSSSNRIGEWQRASK